MSAANPNPMEKSMVSVLVVANAGGGRRCRVVLRFYCRTIVAPGTRGGKQDVVQWIGVLFDRKLSFTYHVRTKMIAASRAFNALCSLVRYETGLSPSATHQLYQACVISRSDFDAEIWWNKQRNLERLLQLQ
jgi:hypothetical protein